MFNWVSELLRNFWRLFVWWVVIQPWEQGLRVRSLPFRRQKRCILKPGFRFRIPYLDAVFMQSTRLRFTTLRPQTLTTQDNQTITLSGVIGYSIVDIDKLYDTLHQAEDSLRCRAQTAIAKFVPSHKFADCGPERIEEDAAAEVHFEQYGLSLDSICLTSYARLRAYRLIMDQQESIYEDVLDTMRDYDAKKPH